MHPQQAREMVTQQLPSQEARHFFSQHGHACYQDTDGTECFLWIPDNESNLYLYGHLADLTPEVSGQLLARALALNLEHTATFRSAIGLNLQTHQLVLRDSHAVSADLDVNQLLSEFAAMASDLRHRLERPVNTITSTHAPLPRGPNPISWSQQPGGKFKPFQRSVNPKP